MSTARAVTVYEVGPRDGLQNEHAIVSTADKIAFVDGLARAGAPVIEVTAFVSPRWVPAMSDAEAVVEGITRQSGTRYSALVPNLRGFERAGRAGLAEVAIVLAASETFNHRNLNASIEESLSLYETLLVEAERSRIAVRAYLSTAFGCPFEGDVPVERVIALTRRLLDLGVFEVAISDTIGVAHPAQVRSVLQQLLPHVPANRLALHFHDTYGMAVANVLAALGSGISTIDASAGGLGGCPYAPGATGNLATEDLCYLLAGMGIDTGIDLSALEDATRPMEDLVGHTLPSRVFQAHAHRRSRADLDAS